jgi:polysaccharide biosynthesis protein PslG
MRLVHAWTAVLVIAVAIVGASPSTALAVPAKFWGVVPQATPTVEQLQRLKRGGVDSVRVPVVWGAIQPTPGGALDWSGVDTLVRGATEAGLEALPFIYDAPSWAVPSAPVPGSGGSVRAPKTLPVKTAAQQAAWSSFLTLAVGRYGPNGRFWAENKSLPQRPIRTWQIWNEQNFKYFVVRPNPAEYGKLLNLSFTTIRGVDPGAKLVLGGMFARPREALFKGKPRQAYFATDFLDRLYRTTPGVKSKFSGVALHPYTTEFQQLTPDIEEFRAVLTRHRDAGKGLWITEIGWSSQPRAGHDAFAKGPKGQVTQLNGAFRLFEQRQAKWKLKRIYWFSVDDQPGSCNFCDGTGLFSVGFVPKKSWFAYVRFAGGTPN